jgi:hypothetical protein
MLERQGLLVRDADDAGSRAIEDAAAGSLLGSARPVAARPGWLPSRPVLEVREADDAPLVFTVRRVWSLVIRYEVRDAEGRPVGSVAGPVLFTRDGRRVATLAPDGAFRGVDGDVLGRMSRAKGGVELHFADAVAADPFGKMLLLATVLVGGGR